MAGALSRKLGELDESAEREKRFSSDVAHELRTPVTGLVAAAALLDDSRAAGMVRERASALAALVEDLLEVMRLESGELPRLDPFDLARLVRDVVHLRLPGAEVDAPPELHVLCDPRRVERIVANLLDNARRHGRPPVRVRVAATATTRWSRCATTARASASSCRTPASGSRSRGPSAAAARVSGSRSAAVRRASSAPRSTCATTTARSAQLRLPRAVTARPSTVQTALEIA